MTDDPASSSSTELPRTLPPEESDGWTWGLLEAIQDPIIVTDADRRVRGWNRAAMLRYGYAATPTVGSDLLEIRPFTTHDLKNALEARLEEGLGPSPAKIAVEGGSPEIWMYAIKGSDARAADPRRSVEGGGLVLVVRDATHEKDLAGGERAELESLRFRLGQGSPLFDALLRQLTTGLAIAEAPSGKLLLHNEMAKDFIERTRVSAMETAVNAASGAQHPDGTPYRDEDLPLSRALRGETIRQEEMTYPRRGGGRIHFSVSAAPVRDEGGDVRFAITTFEDISERKEREDDLREKEEELERVNARLLYDTLHDALTDLPNRVLLLDRLENVLHRRKHEPHRDTAVLFLDFDRFKIVNDSLGHAVGDAMLVAISHVLKAVVRPEDTVARLGGDEFVILLDHIDTHEQAVALAERIEAAFEEPVQASGYSIYTSASIGIVPSIVPYDDANTVLRDADTAMYAAKAEGRGCHRLFDQSMRERAVLTMDLETELREALERQEFLVRYAPLHRVETRELVGFEALVQWQHPKRGLLPPSEFMTAAAETGVMRQIDLWVWREASRCMSTWRTRFGKPLRLSLNFSRQHFLSPEPEEALLEILRETGGDPALTIIELDETALHVATDTMAATLRRLSERGVEVHLDDFGIDHASLYDLQTFSIDALKIDRSIVNGMMHDPTHLELVRVIIGLGGNLGLRIVAEGVEEESQLERLAELGCAYAQGHRFARPLDTDEVEGYLAEQDHRS